jgi:phosphomannomutase
VSISAELAARARAWIDADPDPKTRAELEALLRASATAELESRFAQRLRFGTAGLRGALGAGPNRMNVAVVRAASAGLARWLHEERDANRGVVVGFDHRHGSERFAHETAGVLAAAGIPVRLALAPWPTPVTAHAVLDRGAGAGVMITASHNPAADNGYKVYDATGSQIIPPVDAHVAAGIEEAGPANRIACDPGSDRIERLGPEAVAAYVEVAAEVVGRGPKALRAVYTPVHGVGRAVFEAAWAAAGFPDAVVVAEQAEPDPDFPTAPFPNPEEPGVLDAALALAEREGADLVLANDPDADRLAVAVRTPAGMRILTGDDIGVLLGWARLDATEGDDRVVARSLVSSRQLDAIAAAANVPCRVTLTGFKWISRAGDSDGRRLVFGYEEALGYAVTPRIRDKDGITAALAIADLAARVPLADVLDELAARHGRYATSQWSVRFPDARRAAEFTAAVRAAPPTDLAGEQVVRVVDHLPGAEGLPPADVVALELAGGGRVLIRPSGTEPKVKCYFEVVHADGDAATAAEHLARLRTALEQAVGSISE